MKDMFSVLRLVLAAALACAHGIAAAQAPSAGPRWLEDPKGCRFLDPDPRFAARERIQWSGECVDGYVHGRGQVVLELRKFEYSGVFVKGELRQGKVTAAGNSYEGELKENRPNGRGAVTLRDGRMIAGEFRDWRVGRTATVQFPNGTRYEGEVAGDAMPDGRGKYDYGAGATYEGPVVRGQPQGYGKGVSRSGDRYEGEFLQNQYHGRGVLEYADGARYEGFFVQGARHGQGRLQRPNGHVLEGEWIKDVLHGPGVERLAIGASYEGGFAMGLYQGEGILRLADGSIYRGSFVQGARHGRGRLERANGDVFDGEWAHNVLHGRGIERLAALGIVYEGEFVLGKRQGNGRLRNEKEDLVYEGEFLDGQLHGRGMLRGHSKGLAFVFEGRFSLGLARAGVLKLGGTTIEGEFEGALGPRKARITTAEGERFEIDREAETLFRIDPDGTKKPVTEKELPPRLFDG